MVSSTTVGVRENRFKPQLEGSKHGGGAVEQGSKMCVHSSLHTQIWATRQCRWMTDCLFEMQEGAGYSKMKSYSGSSSQVCISK